MKVTLLTCGGYSSLKANQIFPVTVEDPRIYLKEGRVFIPTPVLKEHGFHKAFGCDYPFWLGDTNVILGDPNEG